MTSAEERAQLRAEADHIQWREIFLLVLEGAAPGTPLNCLDDVVNRADALVATAAKRIRERAAMARGETP